MVAVPGTGADDEVTIDALAGEFQLPVSTVRMYQNRKLLPPPTKRGRVGFYGPAHRERLTMIATLQQRGFSLAAIKETLDSWDAGASVDQLIAAGSVVPSLGDQEFIALTVSQLDKRFGKAKLTQAQVRRAGELGMVRVEGKKVMVSKVFLEAGTSLVSAGVTIEEILDEFESMQSDVSRLAEQFVALFDRHMWQPFVDAGKPPAELGALADQAGSLVALAKQLVVATLDQELTSRADERLAKLRD